MKSLVAKPDTNPRVCSRYGYIYKYRLYSQLVDPATRLHSMYPSEDTAQTITDLRAYMLVKSTSCELLLVMSNWHIFTFSSPPGGVKVKLIVVLLATTPSMR